MHGFTTQVASAGVILSAALLGGPVSTTQVVSSAIMGVGSAERVSKVRWGTAGQIVMAWMTTIPVCSDSGGRAGRHSEEMVMSWLSDFFKPRQDNFVKLLIEQAEFAVKGLDALVAYMHATATRPPPTPCAGWKRKPTRCAASWWTS